MLKKQKRYLYLDDEEISVVLQSLIRLKNTLIHEGRYGSFYLYLRFCGKGDVLQIKAVSGLWFILKLPKSSIPSRLEMRF